LKSTQVTRHCQVKSSQVECDQVDGGRLGVILASSRVVFLYRSDSQVWLELELGTALGIQLGTVKAVKT